MTFLIWDGFTLWRISYFFNHRLSEPKKRVKVRRTLKPKENNSGLNSIYESKSERVFFRAFLNPFSCRSYKTTTVASSIADILTDMSDPDSCPLD